MNWIPSLSSAAGACWWTPIRHLHRSDLEWAGHFHVISGSSPMAKTSTSEAACRRRDRTGCRRASPWSCRSGRWKRAIRPPITTIMNWSSYPEREYEGGFSARRTGNFLHIMTCRSRAGCRWRLPSAAAGVSERLAQGGWTISDRARQRGRRTFSNCMSQGRALNSAWPSMLMSKTRCGWFSDRSACYLASGRPVILQDTGFSDVLPWRRGIAVVWQSR